MENHTKLSGVIITFNEERNIARCIDSLKNVADEIVVVDSFSKDQTKKICLEKNVRFIENKFDGHIEQKNFAISQASYDYVISLDADEALDPKLQQAILEEKAHFKYDAYSFNRLTNYCGKWIKHCGWYPDTKLRIWNKTKGKWGGENPHDMVIMDQNSSHKKLNGDLLHYSYYTIQDHVNQIQSFTDIGSKEAFKKGRKSNIFLILVRPVMKFIHGYIIKAGFLDGFYGFIICANSAYAKFLKYLKLYELNRLNSNHSSINGHKKQEA